MAHLARSVLNAQGVLFAGRSPLQVPITAGPAGVPSTAQLEAFT